MVAKKKTAKKKTATAKKRTTEDGPYYYPKTPMEQYIVGELTSDLTAAVDILFEHTKRRLSNLLASLADGCRYPLPDALTSNENTTPGVTEKYLQRIFELTTPSEEYRLPYRAIIYYISTALRLLVAEGKVLLNVVDGKAFYLPLLPKLGQDDVETLTIHERDDDGWWFGKTESTLGKGDAILLKNIQRAGGIIHRTELPCYKSGKLNAGEGGGAYDTAMTRLRGRIVAALGISADDARMVV